MVGTIYNNLVVYVPGAAVVAAQKEPNIYIFTPGLPNDLVTTTVTVSMAGFNCDQ